MVGDYLAGLRAAASYTQQDVADRLGVSRATVGHWETGEVRISAHDLDRYLDAVFATVWERDRALRLAGETTAATGQNVTGGEE
jgi:transcriptional regulator with XRE-family HTH domain